MSAAVGFNDDFLDMLRALGEAGVEFVVVGAHAMAVHGVARATGDLDLVVRSSAENAARVVTALRAFGAPTDAHGLRADDFCVPGTVYQLGLPPRRIDLLTSLSGVSFDEAWSSRTEVEVDGMAVPFLGLDTLLRNKRATGRDKDLVDLRLLTGGGEPGPGSPQNGEAAQPGPKKRSS
jgi:hypothetical protein